MSRALTAEELHRYTRTQIDNATAVIEEHQPDAVGCCIACGRIWICSAVLDAVQVIHRCDAVLTGSMPAAAIPEEVGAPPPHQAFHHRSTRRSLIAVVGRA